MDTQAVLTFPGGKACAYSHHDVLQSRRGGKRDGVLKKGTTYVPVSKSICSRVLERIIWVAWKIERRNALHGRMLRPHSSLPHRSPRPPNRPNWLGPVLTKKISESEFNPFLFGFGGKIVFWVLSGNHAETTCGSTKLVPGMKWE